MNIEIPDFLLEMSEQMNNQNNRMTADPLFEVRHKSYLVTEDGINDCHWELRHSEDEGFPTFSTRKGFKVLDNDIFDFYEKNEDWCNEWLTAEEWGNNVDTFAEHFDFEYFKENGWAEWPEDYTIYHMQEIEVTVNSHFTEVGAQQFIDRKQHDYPELYIYAISLCYVEQMTELRNWIKALK